MLLLGVDCGATKTHSIIANENLKLLGIGVSSGSNYHVVGVNGALESLRSSISQAISMSKIGNKAIDIACFGICGIRTVRDYKFAENLVRSLNVAAKHLIASDQMIAYYATTLGKPGIVVVAGTGAVAYGRNGSGDEAMAGGWGWLIGDEGSAFYIARKALMRVMKAVDGRADHTILVELAKEHFRLSNMDEIIEVVYHRLPRPQAISSFAKMVSKAAQEGDKAASEILEEAGKELALMAITVANKLGFVERGENVIIGRVGGVWRSKVVSKVFSEEVRRRIPLVLIKEPVRFPVIGALVMGLKERGISVSEGDVRKLEEEIGRRIKEGGP